jgi:ER membrane protein complex subunit 6
MIAYSESAVRNNHGVVEYCRTSMAALSGGTAGILGLTGFYGFGFYMFAVMGLWVILCLVLVIFANNFQFLQLLFHRHYYC